MKTVYRKIFVTTGIGGLLLLSVGTAFSLLVFGDRLLDFAGSKATSVAAEAGRATDQGGSAGLKAWLAQTERDPARPRVLLVDAQGNDILGRAVPDELHARTPGLLKKALPDSSPSFRPARLVSQLETPEGTLYAVFVLPKSPDIFNPVNLPALPLVLVGLALLVTGVVAGVLARSFSFPIRQLAAATRELARDRTKARVDSRVTGRRDELGVLARDFNAMAERLDVLLDARERLIRDMSHELRTPLARLNVALELLRRKDPEGRLAADLARIEQQVDRLDEMIEAILRFSRLDRMAEPPHFTALDLRTVVQEVVEDSRLEAEQRECLVQYEDRSAMPPLVHGHAAILASAVQNVVRNAIRHAPSGTTINVTVGGAEGETSLIVRDFGPGVPADQLEKIFEPFFRGDESRGRDPAGAGLGLAIVTRIVKAHHGEVAARNVPDGGLAISMTFPRFKPGEPAAEPDMAALRGERRQ